MYTQYISFDATPQIYSNYYNFVQLKEQKHCHQKRFWLQNIPEMCLRPEFHPGTR